MEKTNITFTIEATDDMKKFFEEKRKSLEEEEKRIREDIRQHVNQFVDNVRSGDGHTLTEKSKETLREIAMFAACIGWNLCFEYHNNKK